jgi:hypothetical protein
MTYSKNQAFFSIADTAYEFFCSHYRKLLATVGENHDEIVKQFKSTIASFPRQLCKDEDMILLREAYGQSQPVLEDRHEFDVGLWSMLSLKVRKYAEFMKDEMKMKQIIMFYMEMYILANVRRDEEIAQG